MKLEINLSLDVPEGFVVVLKPQEAGGYSFRMVREVKKPAATEPFNAIVRATAKNPLSIREEALPEPEVKKIPEKKRRGAPGLRTGGKANLQTCKDLVQLGEEITSRKFSELRGMSIAGASYALHNLALKGHIKIVAKEKFKTTGGKFVSRNFYALATP